MALFSAYMRFNGNCKEAMQFYKSCLGGDLTLMTVGESPVAAQMPAETHGRILHSLLFSGNIRLMGSDMGAEGGFTQGNTLVLCLVGEKKGEIETFYSKLSKGARINQPLKEEFFGTYGDLTDKYGFNWIFQYSPAP